MFLGLCAQVTVFEETVYFDLVSRHSGVSGHGTPAIPPTWGTKQVVGGLVEDRLFPHYALARIGEPMQVCHNLQLSQCSSEFLPPGVRREQGAQIL